jgi:predicted MFS family arabinose efflux permease
LAEGATPNEASHNPGVAAADNYDVGPPDLISDGDWSVRAGGGARARALLRNRRFLRLWIAQIISNLGDWAYLLAVQIGFTATLGPHQLVRATAVFLGVEGLTSAVVGLTIAGPIVDRYPRRTVMIVADLVRCLAVATLVLSSGPTWLHVVAVAATLGAFRSLFHPAMMATVPDLVEGDSLVVANGFLTSTFHLAIMVGPALGAGLVAAVGTTGAFALNAASFAVSALLLLGVRLPRRAREPGGRFTPLADLREGAAYLIRTPLARGIAIVMASVLLLLAGQGAYQVALVGEVLAPGADQAALAGILGGMIAVFGVGMVVGSLLTPWLSGRFSGRTLLVGALLVVTVAFVLVSRTALVPVALLAWACNGLAGGCVNVTYETMLQVGTPERLRGRVFATVESGSDGAYVVGAALVAGLGAGVGPSVALLAIGVCFLVVAGIAALVIPRDAPMTLPQDAGSLPG